jgi:hypothetical protein
MARIGFFQALFDDQMSWGEAAAINQATGRADAAMEQGNMLGSTIGALQGRVNAQAREIKTLRSLIGVLAGVLRDTGVVDADVLDYRLEAALEEAAEAAAAPAQVTCLRCGKQFPQQQTTLTEMGTMCDRCAAVP